MEVRDKVGNRERDFNPGKVILAMATSYPAWYPGEQRSVSDTQKIRGDLALRTIAASVSSNLRIILSDKDSAPEFLAALDGFPIKVLQREGFDKASGIRQVIGEAAKDGGQVIVRTEPEKTSLIDSIPAIALPISRGEADIVTPKRDPKYFMRTYPGYMHDSEVKANAEFNATLRKHGLLKNGDEDIDMFFGPTVSSSNPDVVALFEKRYVIKEGVSMTEGIRKHVDPDAYSNSYTFPVVEALFRGLRVKSVEIPFEYPSLQRDNEIANSDTFIEKRNMQRFGILGALSYFVRYLNNPNDPKNIITEVK